MDTNKNITWDTGESNCHYDKICCRDIHHHLYSKDILLQHFSHFGRVVSIRLKSSDNSAIIKFENPEGATAAKTHGRVIANTYPPVNIFFCRSLSSDKSKEVHSERISLMDLDDYVTMSRPKELHEEQLKQSKPKDTKEVIKERRHSHKTSVSRRASNLQHAVQAALKVKLKSSNDIDKSPSRRVKSKSSQSPRRKSTRLKEQPPATEVPFVADFERQSKVSQHMPMKPTTENSNQGEHNFEKIFAHPAHTDEEKLLVLEARDTLIRLNQLKDTNPSRKHIKGCCIDMCSEKERYNRITKHCVAGLETEMALKPAGTRSVVHEYMVKEYSRSSADQQEPLAHELRPSFVLRFTMDYIICNIMDRQPDDDVSMQDWYNFIWDRTRSIRKDMTQQQLCDEVCVEIIEKCIRFHIHCAEAMSEYDMGTFDPKINNENLNKSLQTLKYMYHDLSSRGIHCPNEPEFRAYEILLGLMEGETLRLVRDLRQDILKSPSVRFAFSVLLSYSNNNYVKFFNLIETTTYLNACILHRYISEARLCAIQVILRTHTTPNQVTIYPTTNFVKMLKFESANEAALFCVMLGLMADEENVVLDRKLFTKIGSSSLAMRAPSLVGNKKMSSLGEIVNNGLLPENPIVRYHPHNSFDENNLLKPTAMNARDQYEEWVNRNASLEDIPTEYYQENPGNYMEFADEAISMNKSSVKNSFYLLAQKTPQLKQRPIDVLRSFSFASSVKTIPTVDQSQRLLTSRIQGMPVISSDSVAPEDRIFSISPPMNVSLSHKADVQDVNMFPLHSKFEESYKSQFTLPFPVPSQSTADVSPIFLGPSIPNQKQPSPFIIQTSSIVGQSLPSPKQKKLSPLFMPSQSSSISTQSLDIPKQLSPFIIQSQASSGSSPQNLNISKQKQLSPFIVHSQSSPTDPCGVLSSSPSKHDQVSKYNLQFQVSPIIPSESLSPHVTKHKNSEANVEKQDIFIDTFKTSDKTGSTLYYSLGAQEEDTSYAKSVDSTEEEDKLDEEIATVADEIMESLIIAFSSAIAEDVLKDAIDWKQLCRMQEEMRNDLAQKAIYKWKLYCIHKKQDRLYSGLHLSSPLVPFIPPEQPSQRSVSNPIEVYKEYSAVSDFIETKLSEDDDIKYDWKSLNFKSLLNKIPHLSNFHAFYFGNLRVTKYHKLFMLFPESSDDLNYSDYISWVQSKFTATQAKSLQDGSKLLTFCTFDDGTLLCVRAMALPLQDTFDLEDNHAIDGTSGVILCIPTNISSNQVYFFLKQFDALLTEGKCIHPLPLHVLFLKSDQECNFIYDLKCFTSASQKTGLISDIQMSSLNFSQSTHENSEVLLRTVEWLATKDIKLPDVLVCTFMDFVEDAVFAAINMMYKKLSIEIFRAFAQKPKFIINFFNKALTSRAGVLNSQSIKKLEESWPPEEILMLQPDYRYICAKTQAECKAIMKHLQLPPLTRDPEGERSVWDYIKDLTHCSASDATMLMFSVQKILEKSNITIEVENIPWHHILYECVCHLVADLPNKCMRFKMDTQVHYLNDDVKAIDYDVLWDVSVSCFEKETRNGFKRKKNAEHVASQVKKPNCDKVMSKTLSDGTNLGLRTGVPSSDCDVSTALSSEQGQRKHPSQLSSTLQLYLDDAKKSSQSFLSMLSDSILSNDSFSVVSTDIDRDKKYERRSLQGNSSFSDKISELYDNIQKETIADRLLEKKLNLLIDF